MSEAVVSAPAKAFLAGLEKTSGYNVQADGEHLVIAFEPWSLEHEDPFKVPCLRLLFRKVDGQLFLENFTISDDSGERAVDLEAARDALQAWMDCIADGPAA